PISTRRATAARHTSPCGTQRSHTDGGIGSARSVSRSCRSISSNRSPRRPPVSVTCSSLDMAYSSRGRPAGRPVPEEYGRRGEADERGRQAPPPRAARPFPPPPRPRALAPPPPRPGAVARTTLPRRLVPPPPVRRPAIGPAGQGSYAVAGASRVPPRDSPAG